MTNNAAKLLYTVNLFLFAFCHDIKNMFEIKAVFELFILWYVPIIFVMFRNQLSFIKAICIVGAILDPYKSTLLHMQKPKRPTPPPYQ